MQLDSLTPLYTAQLKIAPAFQVIIWDGKVETLIAIGQRFGVSGTILQNDNLQVLAYLRFPDIKVGDYMVFFMDANTKSLHEVLSSMLFHRKYNAFLMGGVTGEGTFKSR